MQLKHNNELLLFCEDSSREL